MTTQLQAGRVAAPPGLGLSAPPGLSPHSGNKVHSPQPQQQQGQGQLQQGLLDSPGLSSPSHFAHLLSSGAVAPIGPELLGGSNAFSPQVGGTGNAFGGQQTSFAASPFGANQMQNGQHQQQQQHQHHSSGSQQVCRMHQQGGCRYGAACRYLHVGAAGAGGAQQQQNRGFGGGFNHRHTANGMGGGAYNQTAALQENGSDNKQEMGMGTFPAASGTGLPNGSAAASPQLLLQALMLQQQLAANGTAPSVLGAPSDLDALIASLSKAQLGATAAPTTVNPTAQQLNNDFLQAQQQLASMASLGGAAANMQQQQRQQQSQGQGQSANGAFNSYQAPRSTGSSFGGGHKPHHHSSAFGAQSTSTSTYHSGGNFGTSMNPMLQPQVRFNSDPTARDAMREVELFGPAHHMPTGINFDRYDEIAVEVTGNDIPGEMRAFSDFDFPPVIRQNIELAKYVKPTPIQKYALPVAFMGRDLMACAQTGSGKTAAFLLPFISHLTINGRPAPMTGYGRNRRYCPVGLILAPTRELATQIYEEACKFTYCTSIRAVVVYGGQDIRQQFRELDRGCDVLVATPGRLMDFLERGRISLGQISYLCLDEADRMLDMGFEPQIRNIVMQQDMSENRQTLMFSATFPKEIQRLAHDFLYNYVWIAVGRVGASSDFITQHVQWVEEENKRVQLMQLLPQCKGLTLIFVERKKSADLLETYLSREGFHATSIHGDRSQHERETALSMFRSGRCPILVATDVAARGLDIPNVLDVVNFDMPSAIDDYVHRIGRTGRAGNVGNAWSFVNEKASHMFKDLFEMLQENKQVVPQWLTEVMQTTGRGGMHRGGGGNKRFGGRDYRKGSYGAHSGGRGGMAQHNLAKMGRFHHGGGGGGHHAHSHHQQQSQQLNGGMMGAFGGANGLMHQFPSNGASAFQANGAMRAANPAGAFNLAAAMTGRPFMQAHQM